MVTTYAFVVDCPRLFHDQKRVVLATCLQKAAEWVEEEMKRCRIDATIHSIVMVGEVVNP